MIKVEFTQDDGYDDAWDLTYVNAISKSCCIPAGLPNVSKAIQDWGSSEAWRIALPDYFRESPMTGSCIGMGTNPQNDKRETVNHPDHYNANPSGVEAIDVIEHLSFNVGNAIKYLWRADHKGKQIEDLKKARWYVDREIQRLSSLTDDNKGKKA